MERWRGAEAARLPPEERQESSAARRKKTGLTTRPPDAVAVAVDDLVKRRWRWGPLCRQRARAQNWLLWR